MTGSDALITYRQEMTLGTLNKRDKLRQQSRVRITSRLAWWRNQTQVCSKAIFKLHAQLSVYMCYKCYIHCAYIHQFKESRFKLQLLFCCNDFQNTHVRWTNS